MTSKDRERQRQFMQVQSKADEMLEQLRKIRPVLHRAVLHNATDEDSMNVLRAAGFIIESQIIGDELREDGVIA